MVFRFAKPGEYVRLHKGEEAPEYYFITHAEKLSAYVVGQNSNNNIDTFGSVSPGSSSGPIEISDLKPSKNHLFQLLTGFKTPVTFYRWISNTQFVGGLDERKSKTSSFREISYWTQFMSPFNNPSPESVLWITNEFVPGLEVYNHTRRTWKPQAKFTGWLFSIIKLNRNQDADIINNIDKGIIPAHIGTLGPLPGKGT